MGVFVSTILYLTLLMPFGAMASESGITRRSVDHPRDQQFLDLLDESMMGFSILPQQPKRQVTVKKKEESKALSILMAIKDALVEASPRNADPENLLPDNLYPVRRKMDLRLNGFDKYELHFYGFRIRNVQPLSWRYNGEDDPENALQYFVSQNPSNGNYQIAADTSLTLEIFVSWREKGIHSSMNPVNGTFVIEAIVENIETWAMIDLNWQNSTDLEDSIELYTTSQFQEKQGEFTRTVIEEYSDTRHVIDRSIEKSPYRIVSKMEDEGLHLAILRHARQIIGQGLRDSALGAMRARLNQEI